MKNSCSLANDKTTTRKDATIFHVTEWPELIKGTGVGLFEIDQKQH